MYEFLSHHNIPIEAVKVANMRPPDMVTAFVDGSIDAYFAWEPHIYYAQKQLPKKSIVISPGKLYYGRHCVAMNQDFVLSNPEIVEKLIQGFLRAEKFVNEKPEEAMLIVSQKTGMDLNMLRSLWKEYKVKVQLDSQFMEILEKETRWGLALKDSQAPFPNLKEYIYTRALSKVQPASVKIEP
jgi:NitT/TauT family transport system substrate-binding protein